MTDISIPSPMRPMSEDEIIQTICKQHGFICQGYERLSGGDINAVFRIYSKNESFVLKYNQTSKFSDLFEKEALGLKLLHSSQSFHIPKVIARGQKGNISFLFLEYIPSGDKSVNFWNIFASRLAKLHQTTQTYFGYETYNYIGTLKQYNGLRTSASDFYIEQRLQPQFELAQRNGYNFTGVSQLYQHCRQCIPHEAPSLIHGDLWSGNYLINVQGEPALIDPATVFAPREMDLAMMQLFGGFDPIVFKYYDTLFPLAPQWKSRIKLWQLYYILVHVNLFGKGYFAQAQSIINHYNNRTTSQ